MTETTEVEKPDIGISSRGLSENTPIFTGDDRGIQAAADEIVKRREAQALPSGVAHALEKDIVGGSDLVPELMTDPEGAVGVTKLSYVDGRPKNQPITAEQAGRDYSAFRASRAIEILKSIDAAQQAEREAAAAAQQPPEPSAEELAAQRQAEEQARAQAEFEHHRAQELASLQSRAAQYENELGAVVASLQGNAQNTFSDIRTVNDLHRLQQTDPARFQAYEQSTPKQSWVSRTMRTRLRNITGPKHSKPTPLRWKPTLRLRTPKSRH